MGRSSARICMLVLILAFLVCEIVLGQICRSLLIAVDSFHTLYVFIHLALSSVKPHPNPASSESPNICASDPSPPYDEQHYRRMRLKPFGILISALLLASQCVSISLEILTHLVQPEAIQHPLLCIVVGGVSLLFNILVLTWRRSRAMDGAAERNDKSLMQNNPLSTSENKGVPRDEALMFCNPEASSVVDPDHDPQDSSSRPQSPTVSVTKPVSESRHSQSSSDVGDGSQEIIQPTEKLPEEPRHSTCTEPAVSHIIPKVSCFRQRRLGFISAMQDLLCSVLILTNGLVLLLSHAHCHRPHSDCHLLVYLDAVFSIVCVLALLSVALPRLHRYGLLVLQATPLHLSVGQVRLGLSEVPGVLSVHELHVWQLSDTLMVASLHVYCPEGMNAAECNYLIAKIKAVLATFGIHHCTVQPEFIASEEAGDGSARTVPGRSVCSLRCGQACVEKLCCSPQSPVCVQEEQTCPPASVDEVKDVIIENTYL